LKLANAQQEQPASKQANSRSFKTQTLFTCIVTSFVYGSAEQ